MNLRKSQIMFRKLSGVQDIMALGVRLEQVDHCIYLGERVLVEGAPFKKYKEERNLLGINL